jgi:hypothetical protein
LDVEGSSIEAGARLVQYECNGGANQHFERVLGRNGFFALRAKHSGQCLTAEGSAVVQMPCRGRPNQMWKSSP